MSKELDDSLRGALRPVDPGQAFTQRVVARIANEPIQRSRLPRPPAAGLRWLSAAVAACVLVILTVHLWQVRRDQQGLHARQQLIEALRVTSQKLDLAYRAVNDAETSLPRKDSGA